MNHYKKYVKVPLKNHLAAPIKKHLITPALRVLCKKKVPSSCVRFCEKTPANIRYIPEILEHYNGKVKIIHLLRDGRDVLTSKHPTNPNKYWVSPSRYIQDVQFGLEYQSHPAVFTVKYEDLVENYEETMRDLCLFLEEDFCPEIKDWSNNTSVTKNRAWSDKVTTHHTKSLRKWEKPEYKERVNEIMTDQRVVNLLKKLSY